MKEREIVLKPIGIIETPYTDWSQAVPVQGRANPESEGTLVLYPEYGAGLKDLEGFSHIILLYHFHKSAEVMLSAKPYLDKAEHGIFAIRSPHRPNHLGLTLVELVSVQGLQVRVKGVDMLHGTPLLDIKPYNPRIDSVPEARTGWMEKAFSEGEGVTARKVRSEKDWLHKE